MVLWAFNNGVCMKRICLAISILMFSVVSVVAEPMNQDSMEKIIKDMALESRGEKGVVEFNFNNIRMYLISDVAHNRMRIIAPVEEYKNLTTEQLTAALAANFHRALDARYALSKGVLYSAYIHPLSELNDEQVKSAVKQVANLALSFGNEYTSGVLSYGEGNKAKAEKEKNTTL